jgi:hypothetical protein
MKRTALALLVFTSFGLVSFGVSSFAQQGPHGDGPQAERSGHHGPDERADHRGSEHMQHMSAEDRSAFLDAHIAAVHAGLKLSPDQEKLWAPAEQAFRDGIAKLTAQMEQWHKDGKTDDALARLRRHAEGMALHADVMRKVADAAQPLYNSLSPEQKKRLPRLLNAHTMMMGQAGHWMHQRWKHMHHEHGTEHPAAQ